MEIVLELQLETYTVAEASGLRDALMHVQDISLSEVALCRDLERHVFDAGQWQ